MFLGRKTFDRPYRVASLSQQIKENSSDIGFDKTGLCNLEETVSPQLTRLQKWVSDGYHAGMSWFVGSLDRRLDFHKVWPEARSLVVTAMRYDGNGYSTHPFSAAGKVARYAWKTDYHQCIKAGLQELESRLRKISPGLQGRIFCDDGPVAEKHWGARSGMGWIGKNSLLITPEHGSWVCLGVLALNRPLEPDPLLTDRCTSCTLCMERCPTGAIIEPGIVDARRCISYWTIESRKSIPEELRNSFGPWIYGCDLCQEACPWNRGNLQPQKAAGILSHSEPIPTASPEEIWSMTNEEFRTFYRGSVFVRLGRIRLLRNLTIAMGNSRKPLFSAFLEKLEEDEQDWLREHARWARNRIADRETRSHPEFSNIG